MSVFSVTSSKINLLFWCIETEEGFTAYGSRKINQLELDANWHFDDYMTMDNPFHTPYASGGISRTPDYDLTTSMRGFTMVTGKTEMEAIFQLFAAFKEEEYQERRTAEAWTRSQEARNLAAKKADKKLHKKAKKMAKEGKFDAPKCSEGCMWCGRETDGDDDECYDCYNDPDIY